MDKIDVNLCDIMHDSIFTFKQVQHPNINPANKLNIHVLHTLSSDMRLHITIYLTRLHNNI